MEKRNRKTLAIGFILLTAFVLWTLAVRFFDVQAIGANQTTVGFASLNGAFHALSGVHMTLYTVTDWLGLVPIFFAVAFALLGLFQMLRRKSLFKVDRSLIALGIFYLTVAAFFLFFEKCVINYRPILIDGKTEASYPSSTTLLVLTVMPSAMMQLYERLKKSRLKQCVLWALAFFTAFMVIARLCLGVHWLSDIIGGALLSAALVLLYRYFSRGEV